MMKKKALAAAAALAVTMAAAGQQRYGIVKYSADFMRAMPDYEAALETQALMGSVCEIVDTSGYWLKISTPEPPYVAWATDMGIVPVDSSGLAAYISAPKYICTAMWTEVFSSPRGDSRVSDLVLGDLLGMRTKSDGKPLKTNKMAGVILPDGREAYVKVADLAGFRGWAESRVATPENLVAEAMRFLGTPYLWGGTSSKGVDCSGLVRMAFFMNGILLRRNASQQVKEGIEIPLDGFVPGVSEGNLRPGDLLFFGRKSVGDSLERVSHVALYIGGGRIIHSSHEVRINSLNPDAGDYYTGTPRLLRVRRMCSGDGSPYTSPKIIDSPYYFPQK